jgi:hypothetical protein
VGGAATASGAAAHAPSIPRPAAASSTADADAAALGASPPARRHLVVLTSTRSREACSSRGPLSLSSERSCGGSASGVPTQPATPTDIPPRSASATPEPGRPSPSTPQLSPATWQQAALAAQAPAQLTGQKRRSCTEAHGTGSADMVCDTWGWAAPCSPLGPSASGCSGQPEGPLPAMASLAAAYFEGYGQVPDVPRQLEAMRALRDSKRQRLSSGGSGAPVSTPASS